jgi:hypothetical protein
MGDRDHWVETLICRRCKTVGIAHLSTPDKLSWTVEANSVPVGFRLVEFDDGINFYCSYCDSQVEP